MLTPEENELFTRVGPGTPAGEMLRRYWWPVGFSDQVADKPVPVRILGEDLVLFRDGAGQVGLLERACAHRLASLEYGRVEPEGIRCCYHGWLYDVAGRCLQQPAEPPESTFKDRVRQRAYQTQEAAGLIFGYLGPTPAPLLPRYDLLFRTDGVRDIGSSEEHCNWLQRAENGIDQSHLPFLHASGYPDMALKRPELSWDVTDYGIQVTTRIPGIPTSKVSCFVFPSHSRITTARIADTPSHDLRLRVPTDDTKTTTYWIYFYPHADGHSDDPPIIRNKGFRPRERGVYPRVDDGWWGIESHEQDRMAQESQGAITDRSAEHLAASDRGIILFRDLVRESIEAVQQGRDPFGVIRDPAQNQLISFDARMQEMAALA
jgi:5,5'-dehydrodivanillate O-demethylase oxygenase subunit